MIATSTAVLLLPTTAATPTAILLLPISTATPTATPTPPTTTATPTATLLQPISTATTTNCNLTATNFLQLLTTTPTPPTPPTPTAATAATPTAILLQPTSCYQQQQSYCLTATNNSTAILLLPISCNFTKNNSNQFTAIIFQQHQQPAYCCNFTATNFLQLKPGLQGIC